MRGVPVKEGKRWWAMSEWAVRVLRTDVLSSSSPGRKNWGISRQRETHRHTSVCITCLSVSHFLLSFLSYLSRSNSTVRQQETRIISLFIDLPVSQKSSFLLHLFSSFDAFPTSEHQRSEKHSVTNREGESLQQSDLLVKLYFLILTAFLAACNLRGMERKRKRAMNIKRM